MTTDTHTPAAAAARLAADLAPLDAGARLRLLAGRFAGRIVASTSFGLQSAVLLHQLREHAPRVPVVFIDTGYLFPETYRHAEDLMQQLGLKVHVFTPCMTAARFEALHGRLWEHGADGLDRYGLAHKVEPMNRALQELGAVVWLSGVRRSHSAGRTRRPLAERQKHTLKVYPILDWSDEAVEEYLALHQLPRHPLAAAGYRTMGDWHSTRPAAPEGDVAGTRFGGVKYECGLHLESGMQDFQI